MADGHEIRADIDTETVKGLQVILGGSAAGLLAALPHVLETQRVSALAPWMVAGTACFAAGLVLTVVHNRFRRKCSLEYSRREENRQPQIGQRWRRFQSIPAEPRVCTHSVMLLWASIAAFTIGAAVVLTGAIRVVAQEAPKLEGSAYAPSHMFVEGTATSAADADRTSVNGCINGSVCFELIKGIPTAAVALVVGIVGGLIAYRQAIIAKAKLKYDLFEKRYAIFLETWKILSEVVMKGTRETNYGLGNPFSNFIPQARFLFGRDVEAYLFQAVRKWADLNAIEGELGNAGPRAPGLAQRRYELSGWFHEQADSGAKALFGPYLNFEKWR
jgi:hypothetical protein